jgi:hypothetical protein
MRDQGNPGLAEHHDEHRAGPRVNALQNSSCLLGGDKDRPSIATGRT